MATPTLELGFLQYFAPIFAFLLVFVLVYAMMQFTKFLGSNKILHSIIAFAVSVIFLFSGAASAVILFIAPWFTVLFIFLIFMIMAYKLFGATDDQIRNVITNWSPGQYIIAVVAIVIGLLGLSFALGQQFLGLTQEEGTTVEGVQAIAALGGGSTATGSFVQNLGATLFNPKILGMALILVIASFTVNAMSREMRPSWP